MPNMNKSNVGDLDISDLGRDSEGRPTFTVSNTLPEDVQREAVADYLERIARGIRSGEFKMISFLLYDHLEDPKERNRKRVECLFDMPQEDA